MLYIRISFPDSGAPVEKVGPYSEPLWEVETILRYSGWEKEKNGVSFFKQHTKGQKMIATIYTLMDLETMRGMRRHL